MDDGLGSGAAQLPIVCVALLVVMNRTVICTHSGLLPKQGVFVYFSNHTEPAPKGASEAWGVHQLHWPPHCRKRGAFGKLQRWTALPYQLEGKGGGRIFQCVHQVSLFRWNRE